MIIGIEQSCLKKKKTVCSELDPPNTPRKTRQKSRLHTLFLFHISLLLSEAPDNKE